MMKTVQLYKVKLSKVGRVSDAPKAECNTPAEAYLAVRALFEGADREMFVVLALDTRNCAIGTNIVSVGSLNASLVHPREIFKFAILSNCAAIIVAHNHPSGDLTPSQDDISLTTKIHKCGEIMGIHLVDHLVIAEDYFLSMRDQDLLTF